LRESNKVARFCNIIVGPVAIVAGIASYAQHYYPCATLLRNRAIIVREGSKK
jgi:hypothetical protein